MAPYMSVFKSDENPNIPSVYIVLKTHPTSYEIYTPLLYGSVIGDWTQSKDTLYLYPKYDVQNRGDGLKFRVVSQENPTMLTITHKLLVKQDELLDVTNYDSIFKDMSMPYSKIDSTVYRRVTSP
jgi:hypothetical protein